MELEKVLQLSLQQCGLFSKKKLRSSAWEDVQQVVAQGEALLQAVARSSGGSCPARHGGEDVQQERDVQPREAMQLAAEKRVAMNVAE